MTELLTDYASGVVFYKAFNHQYKEVYVVCYCLDIQKFDNFKDAQKHVRACMKHSKACG